MTKKLTIILLVSLIVFGCKDKRKNALLPSVSGKAGEVVLVIDGAQWANSVGKEYKKRFLKEFPALPQAEPYFDLVHIRTAAFSKFFKSHRNIVLVKIEPKYKEPKIVIQNNLWAKPQIVINVLAPDDSTMAVLVREKGDIIIDRLVKAERKRLVNSYKKFEDKEIRKQVSKKFDLSLVVPKGYSLTTDTANFVWLSKEEPELSQGIFVYSYPAKSESFLTTNFLVVKRNEFLKKYVPGQVIGSYMQTEDQYEPFMRKIPINNKNVEELRGLWKVENDFMGGPFISFSMYDDKNNRVVCADAFVYAPKFDKRDYIRQLEAILSTFKLEN